MDRIPRRTLLQGGLVAAVGATGVARLLSRGGEDGPGAPDERPAPTTGSPARPGAGSTGEASRDEPSHPEPRTSDAPSTPEAPAPEATGTPRRGAGTGAGRAELDVLCRAAWGAAPPAGDFVEHTPTGLMLHHSAVVLRDNRKAPDRLRRHQRFHQDRGWPDIAYHVGVDRRGNVYDLRPARARGDTSTSYDPAGWFLVVAEGHFDRQRPSEPQLEGVAAVLAWAAGAFGIPLATLAGHRDHASTTCPGAHLYPRLADLRGRAEELRAGGGVERVEVCGPEGQARVRAIAAGRA